MIIIAMVKWHDSSIVNIASNHFTHELMRKVNGQVRGKGKIEVTHPNMIHLYNKGMGGVDHDGSSIGIL